MVICLEQGANDLHMVQLMPVPLPSLASLKSTMVLSFWCWLTQVALEKRLLNGCSSSVVMTDYYLVQKLQNSESHKMILVVVVVQKLHHGPH